MYWNEDLPSPLCDINWLLFLLPLPLTHTHTYYYTYSLEKFLRISGKFQLTLTTGYLEWLTYHDQPMLTVILGFSQSELVHSLAVLLSNYCSYFGHTFTHAVVGSVTNSHWNLSLYNGFHLCSDFPFHIRDSRECRGFILHTHAELHVLTKHHGILYGTKNLNTSEIRCIWCMHHQESTRFIFYNNPKT